MKRATFFSELQKVMWDYNIMKVSKVQNLLIRFCAQFSTTWVPINRIRTWMSMKESPWIWVQAGCRLLLEPLVISLLLGICLKNDAKLQLVEE